MIGIIVNPSSGRDIRRLLAYASVFPTAEKINVVLRLLAATGALGVAEALIMPDRAGIAAALLQGVAAEARGRGRPMTALRRVEIPLTDTVEDTYAAVRAMLAGGVRAIVVLGGDGTHRAVAQACGATPLLTLSTGTNNAFPELREATTAGLALGHWLAGNVPDSVALRRNKRLLVQTAAQQTHALVDVCLTRQRFLGARAVWQPDDLIALAVTFAEPQAIGLSALAGWALPVSRRDPWGALLRFGPGRVVTAPIAPGLVEQVAVAAAERLLPDLPVTLETAGGSVALDGERELALRPGEPLTITLDLGGPLTLDTAAALAYLAVRADSSASV